MKKILALTMTDLNGDTYVVCGFNCIDNPPSSEVIDNALEKCLHNDNFRSKEQRKELAELLHKELQAECDGYAYDLTYAPIF